MRYLLAAEADKIQEFIFRSSRLREVVGASQLLTRFCQDEEGVKALLRKHHGDPQQDICVNDGGSFRIFFDDPNIARQFGADLSELYRLSLGTSISVAEPVPLEADFETANKKASAALQQAKNHRQGMLAEPHLPYMAFCASCGLGLADKYGLLAKEQGDRGRYLCQNCQIKAKERDREPRAILDQFFKDYQASFGSKLPFTAVPNGWSEDTDEIAEFDLRNRNYVAYLVADGNGMGKLFGECNDAKIRKLSAGLTLALSKSLAQPAADFRKVVTKNGTLIPVLPLIMGGDDLFALIPAPYALDFAYRFCQEWERQLSKLVDKIGFQIGKDIPKPTIAAAVVICKSKYPYALAHDRADALLKAAKRQSKLVAAEAGQHFSAVNFEVILGNRLAGLEDNELATNTVQPSLRPYWIVPDDNQLQSEYGLDLKTLVDQRFQLKDVPNKRLNELRRRFEELPGGQDYAEQQASLAAWTKRLDTLIERSGKKAQTTIRAALQALGDTPNLAQQRNHYWRELQRRNKTFDAHGLLDLLETWDFAQDLNKAPKEYEAEEDEA